MDRFHTALMAFPTEWNKTPSLDQIEATGRALRKNSYLNEDQQRAWFGYVVFKNAPVTYAARRWIAGGKRFTSRQVAKAASENRTLVEMAIANAKNQ